MRFPPPKIFLAATVLAVAAATPATAKDVRDRAFTPRTVSGTVTLVRHADEINLGSLHVRLEGIAAPRLGKPLGAQAIFLTNSLAFGKRATCRLTGARFGDAEVGTCRVSGQDIARALVREGLARSCLKLGLRRYTFHEARAKETGIAELLPLPTYCGPDPAREAPAKTD